MKTMKKILAILLCAVLMTSMAALTGAAADSAGESAQIPDCLAWEVQFDKETYGLFDTVHATVTVTNVSDLALTNLTLWTFSDDFSPFAVFYHQRVLASGASCAFPYECRLSPRAAGLPFFARLLLFLRSLFIGNLRSDAVQPVVPDPPSVALAQADFGRNGQHAIRLFGTYDTLTGDPETVAQAVALYNAAAEISKDMQGELQITYVEGSLKADGSAGEILKRLEPSLRKSLTSIETVDSLPGCGPLLPGDVLAASVREDGKQTELELLLADQTDGFDADPVNGGAVARGFGPLTSMKSALEENDMAVESGEETITFDYTQPVIRVTLDSATGRIIEGRWHHRFTMHIGNAQLSMGALDGVTVKNSECAMDFDYSFSALSSPLLSHEAEN